MILTEGLEANASCRRDRTGGGGLVDAPLAGGLLSSAVPLSIAS